MKTKALAILSVFSLCALAQEKCDVVVHHGPFMKNTYSLYFAQEYTGADLVREELLQKKIEIPTSLIGTIDSDVENHAFISMNLMSSQTPSAPLPLLNPTLQSKFEHAYFTEGKDIPPVDGKPQNRIGAMIWTHYGTRCTKERNCPSFMNMSMVIKSPDWLKSIEILTKQKTIVVAASGNWNEDPQAKLAREIDPTLKPVHVVPPLSDAASVKYNYLLVGSTSPSGNVSDFSNGSENVVLTAPASNGDRVGAILSSGFLSRNSTKVEYNKFGGTSAAAPQVTAALVLFEAISGYHPTLAEAKTLLRKSAIKLKFSSSPEKRHGAGNLNTLKIYEIAKRIKKACDGRATCAATMIEQDDTYGGFETNAQELDRSKKAFPACFGNKPAEVACAERTEAIKVLRRHALLNTQDKEVQLGLSCIYEALGYKANAAYYKTVSEFN